MSTSAASFYVTGGTLAPDAPSYVERQADRELAEAMGEGAYCYILTSRQMGKSSLMIRTAKLLRAQGWRAVVLDLTAVGQNVTPEQWFDGLLVLLGGQLGMEDELDAYWREHAGLGPCQRFFSALRHRVLPRVAAEPGVGRLALFIDEIDVVRSLPFSTDEFFAAVRECYTGRTRDETLSRVVVCLLGVATPSDLIRNVRMTPFNIARRIELRDFTEAEAAPLAGALGRSPFVARRILRRVLSWTGGHPYLTQRLCRAVAADRSLRPLRAVDRVCYDMFLSHRAREKDDNLLFVRERLLRADADRGRLLRLYRKVHMTTRISGLFRLGLRRFAPVADEETNPEVAVLRLAGVTRVENGILKVRNRIYYEAFDRNWILANMPQEELWRHVLAFMTGLRRVAWGLVKGIVVAAVVLTVVVQMPNMVRWLSGHTEDRARPARGRPTVPVRDASVPRAMVDLTQFYTARLDEGFHDADPANSLSALPAGLLELGGVQYDVRGVIQLDGRRLERFGYPREVRGIPVQMRCRRIHFLHATGWTAVEGQQVASYVVRYADGRRRFVPVLYGQEVLNWHASPQDQAGGSVVAAVWQEQGAAGGALLGQVQRRLFATVWENPWPEVVVTELDFESALTDAAPFLVAATVEE